MAKRKRSNPSQKKDFKRKNLKKKSFKKESPKKREFKRNPLKKGVSQKPSKRTHNSNTRYRACGI
ncbi:hypothetical protein VN0406_11890 [Helicobacter pylori]|nr:hypothetical protein VN0406_11890 [Helicobacter pylori]